MRRLQCQTVALLGVVTAAVGLGFAGSCIADDVHAAVKKPTNIPAESLGPALQTLAKERHFQIIYVSEQINVLRTKGVSGDLTPEEALRGLLSGTGFTFKYVDEKTVTIVPATPGSDATKTAAPNAPEAAGSGLSTSLPQESKRGFWDRLRLAQLSSEQAAAAKSANSDRARELDAADSDSRLEEVVVTATRQRKTMLQYRQLSLY